MISAGGAEVYQLPAGEFSILVHGRVDVFALAEWVYVRML